jgi:putative PIN family toxin of toxin-antitoxin system
VRVVVDTNVLVSGLLSPHGPPGRIVDGLIAEELRALFDDRMIDEYRDVLQRPKFGFEKREVADFLDHVVAAGEHVSAPPLKVRLPDVDDLPFLEVAVAAHADALITGNLKHFPRASRSGANVVSPNDFVELWADETRSP